jgi:uncharacterized protein (DUF1800 family)
MLVVVSLVGSPTFAGTFPINGPEDAVRIRTRVRAAQFLTHATYGPKYDEILSLAKRMEQIGVRPACEEWIDRQFKLPITKHQSMVYAMLEADNIDPLEYRQDGKRFRQHAWWTAALSAEDQLRQRMAFALMQFFVVGDSGQSFNNHRIDSSGNVRFTGIVNYYDMLLENSFGFYRETLEDVTYHPIMGVWLSHLGNRKPDTSIDRFPDENFAREIMQLFSIGLHQLNQDGTPKLDDAGRLIPTYDNETVRAYARVFTGFVYARGTGLDRAKNLHERMQLLESEHDTARKVVLDRVIPAGQSASDDIRMALNSINKHPNVGPFLARHLIQRFVQSNPAPAYVRRVANVFNNNGNGRRGDFKAVLKAVLLDNEAFSGVRISIREDEVRVRSTDGESSRLREPILRYAAFLRAFDAKSDHLTGRFMIPDMYPIWDQANYKSPTVFNFFSSGFRPPGILMDYRPEKVLPHDVLVAPEFQILTTRTANQIANQLRDDVMDASADFKLGSVPNGRSFSTSVALDFSRVRNMTGPSRIVQRLDLMLCHGTLSDETQKVIRNAIAEETDDHEERIRAAILCVLTSPDCIISE